MNHVKQGFIGAFVFFLLSAINLQAKEWRGIVPLKSTRADVERLLGPLGVYGDYRFEHERATIHYAKGSCKRADNCLCLVSEDTVISIYVEPEDDLPFSTLKLDRREYKKYVSPENPAIATYSNDEEGIIYTVYTVDEEGDDVSAIEYLPTSKDCHDLVTSRARTGKGTGRDKTISRTPTLTSLHMTFRFAWAQEKPKRKCNNPVL